MLTKQDVLNMFEESNALLSGHFKLTSGYHSNQYLQCAKVLQYPQYSKKLGQELIESIPFSDDITVVIGPAIGGITLSYEIGSQLGVKTIFAERENGIMTLRRGFEIKPEDKIFVVEDVITTGGSVKEVIQFLTDKGATVLGVGSIVDRSNGTVDFGIPYTSILSLEVEKYKPEDCPLCKEGIPLNAPGSKFLKG